MPCAALVGKAGPEPDYRHNSGKNQVDVAADIHGHTHGAIIHINYVNYYEPSLDHLLLAQTPG